MRGKYIMSSIENYYKEKLFENGFKEEHSNQSYNSVGKLYSVPAETGKGVYWVYGQEDLYDIKIHDFYFYEDSIFDFKIQENSLSICYYDSISGEEVSPYRRLTAGCVKSFIGGYASCKTFIHKNIPVRAIEIEITPSYYEKHLKEAYPDEYVSLYDSFCDISLTNNFPEMIHLFHQIWNYRGDGMAAKLFYDGKVAEAISLVIEYNKKYKPSEKSKISDRDMKLLDDVIAYINDHFNRNISINHLCHIACMGRTKFKILFKQKYGCTVTEFIQQRRLSHAESLLTTTDFTIQQIAIAVGYTNASRFAAAFKQSTGVFPVDYKKMAQRE